LSILIVETNVDIYRKNRIFLNRFIIADGLEKLSLMMADSNLFVRGQALEIFLSVVDCDVFDWFAPPKTADELKMHEHLLQLMQPRVHAGERKDDSCLFLTNIFLNRTHTYPGGSLRALQLLAFWLSWIRVTYTKDQVLFLSEGMLDALKKWDSKPAITSTSSEATANMSEDEKNLAKTLFEDFGTKQFEKEGGGGESGRQLLPTAPPNPFSGKLTGFYIAGASVKPSVVVDTSPALENKPAVSASTAAARDKTPPRQTQAADTPPTSPTRANNAAVVPLLSRLESLKREGNEHFGKGNFESAIAVYQTMLKHIEDYNFVSAANYNTSPAPTTTKNAEELLTVHGTAHYNIAASYWRIASNLKSKENSLSTTSISTLIATTLSSCEVSCRRALDLIPTHVKAAYRLAATLLDLHQEESALSFIDSFVSTVQSAQLSNGTNNADVVSLHTLRLEVVAALLLKQQRLKKQPETKIKLMSKQGCKLDAQQATSEVIDGQAETADSTAGKVKSKSVRASVTKAKKKLTISDDLAQLLTLEDDISSRSRGNGDDTVPKIDREHRKSSKQDTANIKGPREELLDTKTAKMLEALQKRSQREKNHVTHAWVDWKPDGEER
jgi:hypothetical protein